MAVEYPDIISEYLDAPTRYECGGVQIVSSLEPPILPLEGYSVVILLLQSAVDAPVQISFKLEMPTVGAFRGVSALQTTVSELQADLEPAQVGSLFIPIKATSDARPGEYHVRLSVQAKVQGKGNRVRPSQCAGRVDRDLVSDVVGLDLGRVLGVSYKEVPTSKIDVPVVVGEMKAAEDQPPSMEVKFESLWKRENADLQQRALQEVNARRANILEAMTSEALFVALFSEGQKRFKQADVSIRTGEAVGLGKILTYTVRSFLERPEMQDGLLVPIWEIAQEMGISTMDPVSVLRSVGIGHVVRLSVALSFSLIEKVYGEQPWSLEERRSLTEFIAETLETGEPLPVEFLYIPLLAGAAIVWPRLTLQREDARSSLEMLQRAKAARDRVFEDADLQQASQVFDRLLSTALQGMK
jgi:hypothetical protein